jgi:hemerythrin-like domain-containing protein
VIDYAKKEEYDKNSAQGKTTVKPIGPLMREHRVIERVIAILRDELADIAQKGTVDYRLLDFAVLFFRKYADRCHHGKEEDMLFMALKQKPLSAEHVNMIDELIAEHAFARNIVERLGAAKENQPQAGRPPHDIIDCIETLTVFYPKHIEKEDKYFFFPSLQYLSRDEQDAMLAGFQEFDAKLIHEIFVDTITEMEARKKRRDRR